MAKNITEIKQSWQTIRNETIENANTATRVGGAGVDLVEYVESQGSGKILWFGTDNELNTTFPNPNDGQQAWVGSPYPGTVWAASGGSWSNTGEVPDIGVDPAYIMQSGGYDGTGSDLNNNKSDSGGSPLTMAQMDEKKADKTNPTGGTVVYSDQLPDDIVTADQLVAYTRIDQMNAYAASKDDAADLQQQIDDLELSQGDKIGVAQVNTIPVDSAGKLIKYAVKTSGTYFNFKDSANASLVVTDIELQTKEVEFWGVNNVWQKVIIRTFPNTEQAFVDKLAEANLTQSVQNLASDKTLRANDLAYYATSRVTRVLLAGTSIMADSARGVQGFLAALGNHVGWSGNITHQCGKLGGSYEVTIRGWKKQPYGGFLFVRSRGDSASQSLFYTGMAKRIVIRYSKETDGGECEIWVNGAYSQTINCNGEQRYANEAVIIFDEVEYRNLEIKAPASGYIYLETIDFCEDKPGLHYMQASLGGSSLYNHFVVRSPILGVAGIPIEGNKGFDSIYNNTNEYFKPDVIVCTYTVNDSGLGLNNVNKYFKTALARMAECAAKNNIQIVYVIEMGGHYSLPSQSANNYASFQEVIKTIRSYANHPNITVVDWHKKSGLDTTDFEQIKNIALNNYGVTYNEETNLFTGDFIHPHDSALSLVQGMLTSLFGISPVVGGNEFFNRIIGRHENNTNGYIRDSSIPLYNKVFTDTAVTTKKVVNNAGILLKYQKIGKAQELVSGHLEPLWYCEDEYNYTSFNDLIDNSVTSDKYGKYIDRQMNIDISPIGDLVKSKTFTGTFIVGAGNFSMNKGSLAGSLVVNGKETGIDNSNYIRIELYQDINIVTFHFSNPTGGSFFTSYGKIYACYLTTTDFACITKQNRVMMDSPVKLFTGSVPIEKLQTGKVYKEVVNGKVVKRQCIGNNVIPVMSSIDGIIKSSGLFIALDRTHVKELALNGTFTEAPDDNRYDCVVMYSTFHDACAYLGGITADLYSDKKHTLCGIMPIFGDVSIAFRVELVSGSTKYYLQDNGVWTTDSNSLIKNINLSSKRSGRPLGVTFNFPGSDILVDKTWQLRVSHIRPSGSYYAEWTLAEGSDAMV